MITIPMLSLGVVILLAAITILSVVATSGRPSPAAVTFSGTGSCNPYGISSDTLPLGGGEGTLAGDWHSQELTRLSDVEALLDTLEARHVSKTELQINGNNRFTVRWR